MLVLKINRCDDVLMWYKDLVGCYVPFSGLESKSNYWSIEKTGYKNVVKQADAELVEVSSVNYYTDSIQVLKPVKRDV